jgi:hypothetical protein
MTDVIITPTTSVAYELDHDIMWRREAAREDGLTYDAWLVRFPGWENVNFAFLPTEDYDVYFPAGDGSYNTLPERIEFNAANEFLEFVDYPYVSPTSWPVMSRRMLDTLLSVGEFPHRAFPVVMLDAKGVFDEILRKYVPIGTENHNFVIVQLLEHLDLFDWEQSIYQPHPRRQGAVKRGSVKKVALREPVGGFPPLFCLVGFETHLFLSVAGKAALEAAGIGGARFVPIEKVQL